MGTFCEQLVFGLFVRHRGFRDPTMFCHDQDVLVQSRSTLRVELIPVVSRMWGARADQLRAVLLLTSLTDSRVDQTLV